MNKPDHQNAQLNRLEHFSDQNWAIVRDDLPSLLEIVVGEADWSDEAVQLRAQRSVAFLLGLFYERRATMGAEA